MALKRPAVIPLATSYSPFSLDLRVNWLSMEELNILRGGGGGGGGEIERKSGSKQRRDTYIVYREGGEREREREEEEGGRNREKQGPSMHTHHYQTRIYITGCLQPRELWFSCIPYTMYMYMYIHVPS